MTKFALRAGICGTLTTLSLAGATAAQAQDSLLIVPVLPDDFDRGRNVSVTERARPDYDPLGIMVGGLNLRPRIQTSLGYTSNVYLTNTNTRSDGYLLVSPSLTASSDWSRHQLTLRAGGALQRFFDNPTRNQNAYNLGALGRLDITPEANVTAEVQQERQYETPLNGEVDAPISTLSAYDRSFFSLRGEYRAGQARGLLTVDHTILGFHPIDFGNGTVTDQSDRDRHITRITGQAEYAFTPSVSTYVQGTYEITNYDRSTLISGGGTIPNRDSDAYRVIGGFNFDLAGKMRGSLGAGYTWRNFDAARYGNVGGLSIEGRMEFFTSELTTFTLQARRVLADSAIANVSAYFDNRASIRVDHELLRNLILNASGEIAYIDYIGRSDSNTVLRFAGGGRYLVNRLFGLDVLLSYSDRKSDAVELGTRFDEFRAQVGLVIQR